MTDPSDQIAIAQLAFKAYSDTVGGKSVTGTPIPAWDQLGDTIQGAWVAAGNAVVTYLMGPPATDELTD